jgi:hypothetical protein
MEPIRWLWVASVTFSLFSILCYWRFARNLPSTHENRLSGVKDKASRWLYLLLSIAGGYYLFDLVSAWRSFPLWADLLAFLSFLGIGILVVSLLKRNPKFSLAKIRKLWLAPLGFSCVGMSVVSKVGDQTPAVAAKAAAISTAVASTPVGKAVTSVVENSVSAGTRAVERLIARPTETLIGPIAFGNTIEKGAIGDRVTHVIFKTKKHARHNSKFKGNKGIDAVYTYTDKQGGEHLYLIENKTGEATLSKGQMSDAWIARKLEEMLEYGDKKVRDTATMITGAISRDSKVVVHKVLMEHDPLTGTVRCFEVTADGKKGLLLWTEEWETTMRDVLTEYKEKQAKNAEFAEELVEEAAEAAVAR